MAYIIDRVTIRTNNSEEGCEKIKGLWQDVMSGKIPLMFDSEHKFQEKRCPVAEYSNYEAGETGAYDLSILGVTADFFQHLEQEAQNGHYIKYEERGEPDQMDALICKAWQRVWEDHKKGTLARTFTKDYENAVPAEYTKDGKLYVCLYIAVS